MIDIVQTGKKAIELRRLGNSYSDIAKGLKISKSSVANILKNIKLTEDEKKNLERNLKNKIERGRMKASISIRSRKIFLEKIAYEKAEKEFLKFSKDPLFFLGLGFYVVHGLKKGSYFQFSSSNPFILKIMVKWIEKYLNLSKNSLKYKLFVDFYHKSDNFEDFWAKLLGVYNKSFKETVYLDSRSPRKDKEYRGSLSIIVTNIAIFRTVMSWQKLLIGYYTK